MNSGYMTAMCLPGNCFFKRESLCGPVAVSHTVILLTSGWSFVRTEQQFDHVLSSPSDIPDYDHNTCAPGSSGAP